MSPRDFVAAVEDTFRQLASRSGGAFGEGVGARGYFDEYWDFVVRERERIDSWQCWGVMGNRYGLTWYLLFLHPPSDPESDEALLSMFVENKSSAMVRFTGPMEATTNIERPVPIPLRERLERDGFEVELSVCGVRVWAPADRARALFGEGAVSVDRFEDMVDTTLELTREMAKAEGDRYVQ